MSLEDPSPRKARKKGRLNPHLSLQAEVKVTFIKPVQPSRSSRHRTLLRVWAEGVPDQELGHPVQDLLAFPALINRKTSLHNA